MKGGCIMKVILLQDVKGVGKKGQTVEVSDGYANNFLVPRRLAVISTERSREILELQNENKRLLEEKKKEEAIAIRKKLETIVVELQATAGKDGKMFGSISSKQICEELKNQFHVVVDKRKILNRDSVNVFGTTNIQIELYKDVIGTIKVHVTEKVR